MTIETEFLTRDELSDAVHARYGVRISYDMLRKNEKRWGLGKAKVILTTKVIYYRVPVAFQIFDKLLRRNHTVTGNSTIRHNTPQ